MAQTLRIELKPGITTDIDLTQCIYYIDFDSIKDPRAYVYKRYALSMITLSPESVPESADIPIISIGHDRYGRTQIYYNEEILTPGPIDKSEKLTFRWIQ